MVGQLPKLPKSAWLNVALWVSVITGVTTATSLAAAAGVMIAFNGVFDAVGLTAALVLPLVMAPPVVGVLSVRHQQLKLANAELRELAYKDAMLGCMNRHGFTSALEIALEYASPHRPCALLVIDADNFKQVNDRFGHDQGDEALQIIANAIKSAIRLADLLGRIGGEEFGAFLPGADEKQAREIAHRICKAVAAARFAPDGEETYPLSVSIGGFVATEPTRFAKLYRAADKRLYTAKRDGRNRFHFDRMIDEPDLSAESAA